MPLATRTADGCATGTARPTPQRGVGHDFWSQRYDRFDEIFPPRKAPYSHNPSSMLDFRRFTSDMLLECYLMEREILLDAGATQPITTNFMGPFKPADYSKWAPFMDVIADDCYPDPTNPNRVRDAAFQRDLMRSLKPGVPWILMEQATDAVNWRPSNPGKAPGVLLAETAQSIARGADGIMFFQWRQSRAGSEKFHSAMLPHAGTDTRRGARSPSSARDSAAASLPAPGRDARVALVFDWENWWAVEERDHPVDIDYLALSLRWYGRCTRAASWSTSSHPSVSTTATTSSIAPALYLLREEGAAALTLFVEGGGTLAHRSLHRHRGRSRPVPRRWLPHPARAGAGRAPRGLRRPRRGHHRWHGGRGAERTAVRGEAGGTAGFVLDGTPARGTLVAEVVEAVDATVVARFTDGPAAGFPAVTRRATAMARPGTSRRCRTPRAWTPSSAPWWTHPESPP